MKKLKLAVLPGDGIGRDVTHAAIPVLKALNVPVDLHFGEIGWDCWMKDGDPVPDETWKLIAECDATLLGATTSMPEREAIAALPSHMRVVPPKYVSPIVQLRQKLDLYANVRPCFNVKGRGTDFKLAVIRENTEGLYAGLDYYPLTDLLQNVIKTNPRWAHVTNNNAACSLRLQTEAGLRRLFEYAFNYAKKENFSKVTFADKPNVLRQSSVFARGIFESVARLYPEISNEIHNVDAVGLWLVKRPEDFGVIVAENMFGDILSDVAAGVMGGLGFAPSANIGKNGCYFEPVHGSAPRVKRDTSNPSAMFLTIGLLLENFGYQAESQKIKRAVRDVINVGRHVTYDLGGNATTQEMAAEIIDHCLNPYSVKRISFLATGNEIVYGDVQDTNTSAFAQMISEKGGSIYQRMSVSDKKSEISSALKYLLDASDAVVVTGGLGPTIDDTTRYAIADVTKCQLYFDEQAWNHIVNRLTKFSLPVAESNRQQAMFPQGSEILTNDFGTACGAYIEWNNKQIYMLPGPPRECKNMFDKNVIGKLEEQGYLYKTKCHRWLTLGLIEGEISPVIDKISKLYSVDVAYKWSYPYLEIKLTSTRHESIDELIFKLDNLLEDYLVSKDGKDALTLVELSSKLSTNKILISDQIQTLNDDDQKRFHNIQFVNQIDPNSEGEVLLFSASKNIKESSDYSGNIDLTCTHVMSGKTNFQHTMSFPNRGPEVSQFVTAYIAWQTHKFIEAERKSS